MAQKRVKGLRGRYQGTLADVFRGQPDAVANAFRRGWNQEDYPITPT